MQRDGRHLCFGQFVPDDYMCRECPEWLKANCVQHTPGAVRFEEMCDAQLEALHRALDGN